MQVRINSIQLLDTLLLGGAVQAEQQPSLINLLYRCSRDLDYRVRAQAARAIHRLYQRAAAIPNADHYKVSIFVSFFYWDRGNCK